MATSANVFTSASSKPSITLLSEAVQCTFPILQKVAMGWITVLLSRHLLCCLIRHPSHDTFPEKKKKKSEDEEKESNRSQSSESKNKEFVLPHPSVSSVSSSERRTRIGVDILRTLEEAILSLCLENPSVDSSLPTVKDGIFAADEEHEKMDLLRTYQQITQNYLSWMTLTRAHLPSTFYSFSRISSMSNREEEKKKDIMTLGAWWLQMTTRFLQQWIEERDQESAGKVSKTIPPDSKKSTVETSTSCHQTEAGGSSSSNPKNARKERKNGSEAETIPY